MIAAMGIRGSGLCTYGHLGRRQIEWADLSRVDQPDEDDSCKCAEEGEHVSDFAGPPQ